MSETLCNLWVNKNAQDVTLGKRNLISIFLLRVLKQMMMQLQLHG